MKEEVVKARENRLSNESIDLVLYVATERS